MNSTSNHEAALLIDRLARLSRAGSSELNPAQWEALRYVARSNRFSRTPAALADYLASTRGTVSQTLIALEQKGYVERLPSARDRRSIDIMLTQAGESALTRDPLLSLASHIEAATGPQTAALVETLRGVVQSAIARNRGRAFGACQDCRYFQRNVGQSPSPHRCALLNEPLSDGDRLAICVEQDPRIV